MPAMDYSKIADWYDIYVQSDLDVDFFLEQASGCDNVLELTSGTGRLSVPLIEAGIPLSCLDNSPEMVAILRNKLRSKGLEASVYEMDVCRFSISDLFDLIIFPFNSFAEIVDPVKQKAALRNIHSHLTNNGRFICTLHNPAIRRKLIDGQVHLRGKFPVSQEGGALHLSSVEHYDQQTNLVTGTQFFDLYNADGVIESKRSIEIRFALHSRKNFLKMIHLQGFRVVNLFGNYKESPFNPEGSPFMLWILDKG